MRRPRLVYVVTHPVTANVLLRGQLAFMREQGFEVTVISAPGPDLERVREREGVTVVPVPMARDMNVRTDPRSLKRLIGVLRELRPDIVNAGTTKAGLLGMLAARVAKVPVRIYLLRGLRLETAKGVMRSVLATTERIASACAHDVVCVSPSLLDLAVSGGHIPSAKASVVGNGSSNGYDLLRFRRSPELRIAGDALVRQLGVGPDEKVIAFIGRLAADKGIDRLLDAFEIVRRRVDGTRLLLIGGDLGDEVADERLVRRVRSAAGVLATGRIADLAPWYARLDVLVFPSYREGFPNVPAEAAAAEVPVVGFRTTGTVDAVSDGVTGALVTPGDAPGLAAKIIEYLERPELARIHGAAARDRIAARYEQTFVWRAWLDFYRSRLAARCLPLPAP